VVTGPRKSRGYRNAHLSDSDWEADVLPFNYTRFSGFTSHPRLGENKSESDSILSDSEPCRVIATGFEDVVP
jgi:hypothetical protein